MTSFFWKVVYLRPIRYNALSFLGGESVGRQPGGAYLIRLCDVQPVKKGFKLPGCVHGASETQKFPEVRPCSTRIWKMCDSSINTILYKKKTKTTCEKWSIGPLFTNFRAPIRTSWLHALDSEEIYIYIPGTLKNHPCFSGWKWWFPTIFYVMIWFIIQLEQP